ncbi:MAG: hypothetical protein LBK76_08200 [Verrucomicrobiales bacterium]|nr:hypothetical protein [Verrucomicrobiales bacterium]
MLPRHLRRGRVPLMVTRAPYGLCWGAYVYFLDSVAAARLLATVSGNVVTQSRTW